MTAEAAARQEGGKRVGRVDGAGKPGRSAPSGLEDSATSPAQNGGGGAGLEARAARRLVTSAARLAVDAGEGGARAGGVGAGDAPAQRRPFAALVREIMRAGLEASPLHAAAVAGRLGISSSTLDSYTRPSREEVARGDVLLALLCRDDLVPEAAREGLLRRVCGEAGFFCVRLPDRDADLDGAVTALAEELGRLAGDVRRAEEDGALSGEELERIGRDAGDLAARAMGLAAGCRERMSKGGRGNHRTGDGR